MSYTESWGDVWHYTPSIMLIFMLLVMAVCIFILYGKRKYFFNRKWFSRNWNRRWIADCCTTSLAETPEDILKKRYALGEITKEEFEQMIFDIRDANQVR